VTSIDDIVTMLTSRLDRSRQIAQLRSAPRDLPAEGSYVTYHQPSGVPAG